MRFFIRITVAVVGFLGLLTPSAGTAAPAADDPAARAAFIAADREALLARIHPRWRDFTPRWQAEVCPFKRTAKYDPAKVTCGYVRVPENRRDPNSRLIRIAVAKVASTAKGKPSAGPTVYLSGGPGGPSLEGAASMSPEKVVRHRAWLAQGDQYFVEQRGIGYSDAPICRGLPPRPARPLSAVSFREMAEQIRDCLAEARLAGIDVDAYTTWDDALDFRDIRRALGLASWNIFGVSYGTELGQMVLRVDGDAVRAAVLDSVVAPPIDNDPRWRLQSAGFLASMGKLNEACAADPACKARYGDLVALAKRAVAAYDAKPYTITGLDPEAYAGGKMVVNGPVVANAVFNALYRDEYYPAIPALLEALATRQADDALAPYVKVLTFPADHQWGHGMTFVNGCAGFSYASAERIAAQAKREPFWSAVFIESAQLPICPTAGRPPADPLEAFTPLVTDRPVLLLAGGADPITPAWEAEALKSTLPGAPYVLAPWVGHGIARSDDCVGAKILPAFLDNPTGKLDTSCVADMAPPKFVLDYKPTSGPITLYTAYEEGKATGALAWLGGSLAVLLIGVIGFAAGPVARRIDRRAVIPAGGARRAAAAGALLGLIGAGLIGWAIYTTVSEHVLLAPLGLAGPAQLGSWLILAGAVVGLVAIALLVRAAARQRPPVGTMLGVVMTGLAGAALAGFAAANGLL